MAGDNLSQGRDWLIFVVCFFYKKGDGLLWLLRLEIFNPISEGIPNEMTITYK
jgi:hypothetical protein